MSNEPGLTERVAPGSALLQVAADMIVASTGSPNLSAVVVLVPNLYVVQSLQRALQRAAGGSALLLPTITTLALWADSVHLAKSPIPDSRRLAWLHSALHQGTWFQGLDLWQVAAEILALIDDCSRYGIALPESVDDFQRVVRQALRASENHAINFEAKLVHELWRALQGDASEFDRHGAYALRLAELAVRAESQLYVINPVDTTPAEATFLARYAERRSVVLIRSDDQATSTQSPLFALLRQAWIGVTSTRPLLDRAIAFQCEHPESPAKSLSLFGARNLEQEAHAVELTVRRWLYEGKRSIAIIAQDRLTARRARARLERAQILIADESGWTLSTTTASSVVMRWLDVIGGDFYFRDLFDFFSSPFLLSGMVATDQHRVRMELEKALIDGSYIGGLHRLRSTLERVELSPMAAKFTHSLFASAQQFGRKSRSLSNWLRALFDSLEQLNATAALHLDAAGRDLLKLLQTLATELEGEKDPYSLGEWRRWLDRQLEDASFRDSAIDSSVVLTHLGLTDGRVFDGVILLGADADHLPSPAAGGLFNDAVLRQLGLPGRDARVEIERRRLMHVLAHSGAALVTWQSAKGNEPNPPSPYWVRLIAFHRVAYGQDLSNATLIIALDNLETKTARTGHFGVLAMPKPAAPDLLPQSLSAYQYGSLIACPYQFFVHHLLALRVDDEVVEALEKKDYGDLVHRILSEFHRHYSNLDSFDDSAMSRALREISEKEFQAAPEGDYFARAWRLRWEQFIPAYLVWQRRRETDGWRWQASEVSREQILEFSSGRSIRLKGRLDRLDVRNDESKQEQIAVLDYKTGNGKQLKDRAADPSEDGQLPFYGIVAAAIPSELAYVALDDDPVVDYVMSGDVEQIVADHKQRLQQTLNAIATGQGLPAQGIESVCAHCEAAGMCRKRYWENGHGG